jgi:hypothetical protein
LFFGFLNRKGWHMKKFQAKIYVVWYDNVQQKNRSQIITVDVEAEDEATGRTNAYAEGMSWLQMAIGGEVPETGNGCEIREFKEVVENGTEDPAMDDSRTEAQKAADFDRSFGKLPSHMADYHDNEHRADMRG